MASHTETVQMNSIMVLGETNNYYSYNGILYTITFPYEWAKKHIATTGPEECLNCKKYGFYNGVFVGYCYNCATDYCDARRKPFCSASVQADSLDNENKPCWMIGIPWQNVGKIELLHDSIQKYYLDQLSMESMSKFQEVSAYMDVQRNNLILNEGDLSEKEQRISCVMHHQLIKMKKVFECRAKLVEKKLMREYAFDRISEQDMHLHIIGKSIKLIQFSLENEKDKNEEEKAELLGIKLRLSELCNESDLTQQLYDIENPCRVSAYMKTSDVWADINELELELVNLENVDYVVYSDDEVDEDDDEVDEDDDEVDEDDDKVDEDDEVNTDEV